LFINLKNIIISKEALQSSKIFEQKNSDKNLTNWCEFLNIQFILYTPYLTPINQVSCVMNLHSLIASLYDFDHLVYYDHFGELGHRSVVMCGPLVYFWLVLSRDDVRGGEYDGNQLCEP